MLSSYVTLLSSYVAMLSSYVADGDMNPGPHAYTARALTPEMFPQPIIIHFYQNPIYSVGRGFQTRPLKELK